jgi:UDP-N-acetylmuramoylalanine--D-glutamate ligase
MRLRELDGRRVLVWGLGREGRAALGLLNDDSRCRPASVVTFDDGMRESGVTDRPRIDLSDVDVIVKSPGVSRYRPELVAFVAKGGEITGLTALVLAERAGERTIGITGTKGKSTTSSLVAHLLAGAGVDVELAGNIGRPAAELLEHPDRWVVLECSSYQCADVDVSPNIGVLTSLYQEHLDWHGSYDRYVDDKLNLFRTSSASFVNGMQPECVERTSGLPSRRLVLDGDEPVALDELPLLGVHNRRNANLAVHAAAHALGEVHSSFRRSLSSFQPLEHRLHTVGEYRGHLVVDDVLATAPEAVLNALEVFADRKIVLLVGGYDREIDYRSFGARLAARNGIRVVAMGPAGRRIADEMTRAGAGSVEVVDGLREAIDAVDRLLDTDGEPSTGASVLLLSPGATSYGEFADYRARSSAFRSLLLERGLRSV